jgi:hypothetical protein
MPKPPKATLSEGAGRGSGRRLPAPRGYHCPADQSKTTEADGTQYARVRSVSMNAFVGPWDSDGSPVYSGWAQFVKLGGIRNPANIFVFLDEHPDFINDGWYVFCNNGPDGNLWSDMPASYESSNPLTGVSYFVINLPIIGHTCRTQFG